MTKLTATPAKVVSKKLNDSHFRVADRFDILAQRTESGYIRDWAVVDSKPAVKKAPILYRKTKAAAIEAATAVMDSELSPEKEKEVRDFVKRMLHSARDTMRNRDQEGPHCGGPNNLDWANAYGVLQGIALLGFMDMNCSVGQHRPAVQDLLHELEKEVLAEENYGGSGHCPYCLNRWGKDDQSVTAKKKESVNSA